MTFCPACLQWSPSEAVLDGARVAGVGADKPEQCLRNGLKSEELYS